MILSYELQNAYNRFYKDMRKYIWSYEVVDALASLEISIYRACPDPVEIRSCITRLKSMIYANLVDDSELKDSLSAIEDLLSPDVSIGCMIDVVREVIPVENN